MKNVLEINTTLDEIQLSVLNCKGDIIIDGCAGSGKTLLAIKIAKKYANDPGKKVLIVAFTSSLVSFIANNIDEENVSVRTFQSIVSLIKKGEPIQKSQNKILIIEEAQDFTNDDLNLLKGHFKCKTYIFVDFKQQAYSKYRDTVKSSEELQISYPFETIKLTKNYRISNDNVNFIRSLYDNSNLFENTGSYGKPIIKKFSSIDEEINHFVNYCKENTTEEIGILFHENPPEIAREVQYMFNRKEKTIKLPSIGELVGIMVDNNIDACYKFKLCNNLNSSKDINVNLMTIHSSKGLEFDTVILPFSNDISMCADDYIKTLYYIAMTRSIKKIIITYTDFLCDFYKNAKDETFIGERRFMDFQKDYGINVK